VSRENVEIVRELYDAWNRGDFDAAWRRCDAELVSDRSRSIVDRRIYRGTKEVEQFWNDWKSVWETARWEIDEYIDAGDDVVVLGRFHGRGVNSGASVEANVSQLMTVRNGKLVRGVLFQSRSDALQAAGLRA
jgi:ketosteroid isomerase-like protein